MPVLTQILIYYVWVTQDDLYFQPFRSRDTDAINTSCIILRGEPTLCKYSTIPNPYLLQIPEQYRTAQREIIQCLRGIESQFRSGLGIPARPDLFVDSPPSEDELKKVIFRFSWLRSPNVVAFLALLFSAAEIGEACRERTWRPPRCGNSVTELGPLTSSSSHSIQIRSHKQRHTCQVLQSNRPPGATKNNSATMHNVNGCLQSDGVWHRFRLCLRLGVY